jgi:hypothetical protein
MSIELERDIKLDRIGGKYMCTSAYKIPKGVEDWLRCPNCELKPLVWEFDNGRSTACGCGKNEYDHFSVYAESIMSYGKRSSYNFSGYNSNKLKENWNQWVETGKELEPRQELLDDGKW